MKNYYFFLKALLVFLPKHLITNALLVFGMLFMLSNNSLIGQINSGEGLNMPGTWDFPTDFQNPPTNAFLRPSTSVCPPNIYQTTFLYAPTVAGGDVIPDQSPEQFKFTSGPAGGEYDNQWTINTFGANGAVVLNTFQTYNHCNNGCGPPNNDISLTSGNYYVMNWRDNGYQNTQAVFIELSANPVTIDQLNASANCNQVDVCVDLSGTPSAEETFYIRYSEDGFGTSTLVEMTVDGTTACGVIPDLNGATETSVEYYVFSSSLSTTIIETDYDLATINCINDGGNNYNYMEVNDVNPDDINGADGLNLPFEGGNVDPLRFDCPPDIYQSTFTYTGATGTQNFIFESGGINEWTLDLAGTGGVVNLNTFQDYFYTVNGNPPDNLVSMTNGNAYVFNFIDQGYTCTQAIVMETEVTPVDINSRSENTDCNNKQICAQLSATPSPEERFYVRYTSDNFANSTLVELFGSGDEVCGTIPNLNGNTNEMVTYYLFSSTLSSTDIGTNYDLATINCLTNGGSNYTYTEEVNGEPNIAAIPTQMNTCPSQTLDLNDVTIVDNNNIAGTTTTFHSNFPNDANDLSNQLPSTIISSDAVVIVMVANTTTGCFNLADFFVDIEVCPCPEITNSTIDDADGEICPDTKVCFDITEFADLPDGGTIDYYWSATDDATSFNPYDGEGTLLGSADINSANPNWVETGFTSTGNGESAYLSGNNGAGIWTNGGSNTPGVPNDGSNSTFNGSNIIVNEVLYDGPNNCDGGDASGIDAAGEYVEIAGPPGTNIGCFQVSDGDWTVLIPSGTTIPSDGIFLIAADQSMNTACPPTVPPAEVDLNVGSCNCIDDDDFTFTNESNSNGEYVAVFDDLGNFISGVTWGNPSTTNNNSPCAGNLSTNPDDSDITISGCSASQTDIPIPATASSCNDIGVKQFCYTFDNTFCNTTADGEFTVKAIINPFNEYDDPTDAEDCFETDDDRFEAFTLTMSCPVAALSGGGTICANETTGANLIINVTNGTAPYEITYNDGTTDFVLPNEMPDASGNVTVNLTPSMTTTYSLVSINDANGCAGSVSGSATITVNEAPDLAPIADQASVCPARVVDLTSISLVDNNSNTSSMAGTVSYHTISNPANSTDQTVANPSMVAMSGTYYIRKQVGDCFDIEPVVVSITVCPCPEITASTTNDMDGIICSGTTVCFDITEFADLPDDGNGTIDYYWAATDDATSFNPYAGGVGNGTLLGSAPIIVSPNSCDDLSDVEGFYINEVGQGSGGSEEYAELLAVGSSNISLNGWGINDNDGINFSSGGVAAGYLIFDTSNDPSCSCLNSIPPGSLVIVYNEDDVYAPIPLDDLCDANNDGVYVIPGNSVCFDQCSSSTSPCSSADITNGVDTDNNGEADDATIGWQPNSLGQGNMQLGNSNDAFLVYQPDGSLFHGISWGSPDPQNCAGNPSTQNNGGNNRSFINESISTDVFNSATFDNTSAQTPGLGNTTANTTLIDALKNGTFSSANCTQFQNNGNDPITGESCIPEMLQPQQFCYTFDDTFCNTTDDGKFTVKAIINPFTEYDDPNNVEDCLEEDPERFEAFTLTMLCPTATLSGGGTICSDATTGVDLIINITDGAAPYTIVYNDGTTDITLTSQTPDVNDNVIINLTPSATTNYSLVSVTDANGCTSDVSGTATITVIDAPDAGSNGTASACDNSAEGTSTVDLDTALGGNPDTGGSWSAASGNPSVVTVGAGNVVDFNGASTGSYTFTYTVTGTSPCSDATADVVVTVADCIVCPMLPTAPTALSVSSDSDCNASCTLAGGAWALANTPCPTGSTLQSFSSATATSGGVAITTAPMYNQSVSETFHVRCVCNADATVFSPVQTVSSNPGTCIDPDANVSVSDATACNPAEGDVVFMVTSPETGVTYELKTMTGMAFTPPVTGTSMLTLLQADVPNIPTMYQVTATNNATTCSTVLTIAPTLNISDKPTPPTPSNTAACSANEQDGVMGQDDDVDLDDLIMGGSGGGVWSAAAGNPAMATIDANNVVDFTGSAAGTYTFTYTQTTAPCPPVTTDVQIIVSDCSCTAPPSVMINEMSVAVCEMGVATFNYTVANGPATVTANGAGTLSPTTLMNGTGTLTYTPAAADYGMTITVTATIADPDGTGACVASSDMASVVVDENPTMSMAGDDQTQCNDGDFTLAGNTPTVGTGTWTVISGTATITTPMSAVSTVTGVPTGSSATLRWTISTTGPCPDSVDDVVLTNNDLPIANATNDGPICSGDDLTLNETGGDASSWSWTTTGGGTFNDASLQSPTVTNAADGDVFTVMITDGNTCMSSSTTTVVVDENPTPSMAGMDQSQCNDGDFTLAGNTPTVGTGMWMVVSGTATITTPSSPTSGITGVPVGTSAILSWTISTAGACPDSVDDVVLTNNALPTATATNNGPICMGADLVLNETGGDATSWSWSTTGIGAFDDASLQSPTVTNAENGDVFTVTVTDANGCTNTSSTTVVVNANPTISGTTELCVGEMGTVLGTGVPANNSPYVSSVPSVVSVDFNGNISAINAGIVEIFYTDANGCTAIQIVTANEIPEAPTAPSAFYCVGETVETIEATGLPGAVFTWYQDAGKTTLLTTGISGANNEFWTPNMGTVGTQIAYVTQTVNGCESDVPKEVSVEIIVCDGDEFEVTNNFMVTDPCTCNNDQTDNISGSGDGSFSEVVTVSGPTGVLVRVLEADQSGMGDANLPAGPYQDFTAVDFPLMLMETAVGSGVYEVTFDHADGVGYSINRFEFSNDGGATWATVTDMGEILSVSNRCLYPQISQTAPSLTCIDAAPITLDETFLNVQNINGNDGAFSFTPTTFTSATSGNFAVTVMYTSVDDGFGGDSPDNGITAVFPGGCETETSAIFITVEECPATNYAMERVCQGNAVFVKDADTDTIIPNISNAVYTWFKLDADGVTWVEVSSVNSIPYYSPTATGTYSFVLTLEGSDCVCTNVGDAIFVVDEILNCKDCP